MGKHSVSLGAVWRSIVEVCGQCGTMLGSIVKMLGQRGVVGKHS